MGPSLERSATYSSTAARPTALRVATRRDFGSHVCVPPGYNVYDSRTHMSTSELPEGWVTQVKQAWMLPPFLKQLQKRQREQALLEQLGDCLEYLYRDPRQPGLNLETLRTNTPQPVLSARIDRSNRLILAPLPGSQIGLLYFDKHEEAYDWVRRQGPRLATMMTKQREAPRGTRFSAGLSVMPVVRADEDSEIALASAAQFRQMVDNGVARYLTYLDDEQRRLAELRMSGLLLVKGGAGTGKTAVAIHRLLNLVRQPVLFGPRRVLYLCYNAVLARAIGQLVDALCAGKRPEGIEIRTFHAWCLDFLREHNLHTPTDRERPRSKDLVAASYSSLARDRRAVLGDASGDFIFEEIVQVIKHNGLNAREQYLKFNREGRGIGLKETQRDVIWDIYQSSETTRRFEGFFDWDDLPNMAMEFLDRLPSPPHFRAVIVDEAQDCTPVMMRLARRLLADSNGPLTVFADPAQAIYQHGFQWTQRELRPAGGNVRWLRKNYRCTREIYDLGRTLLEGDPSLEGELAEVQPPERHGSRPALFVACRHDELIGHVVENICAETKRRPANQIAVLASRSTLRGLADRLSTSGVPHELIDRPQQLHLESATVKLLTPQGTKGLDFPVVFLIPSRYPRAMLSEELSPESRRTLYVGLTRASEQLTIGTVYESHPPLLELLDPDAYTIDGPCGREFHGTRGTRLPVGG